MYPPIFQVCAASAAVTALIGTLPVRLFEFGEAPQDVATPYVLWQVINGSPEHYLADRPDLDSFTLQVDVYAASGESARTVVTALRDAIEPHAQITRWGGGSRDPETRNYRESFDVDWFVHR